jgi:hypothetical protein
MRLYNTEGATQVDDPEFGTFKPSTTGAFDGLPDPMYAKLHGRPGWENEAERATRLAAEQMEKLRDPATMLAELQKMTAGQGALASLLANALGVAQPASSSAEPANPATAAVAPAADPAPAATPPAEAEAALVEKAAPAKSSRASKKTAAAPPDA